MAHRREILTVYAAGLVQGVALVTFPAANAVFTDPSGYGLSGTEYGAMFLPQAVAAIVTSLLGAGLRKRLGTKRIFFLGLAANLLAMTLLVVSRFVMKDHVVAYGILLAATAAIGAGFGFTVPALNTFAAAFFPSNADRALLILNALLGLGTALAPVFVSLFIRWGFWWGLPLLVGALMLGLLLFSAPQALKTGAQSTGATSRHKSKLPPRFWIFASFALLYGVSETMNGNWAVPYMTTHFGASAFLASLALAVFWSMVTAGRLLFAGLEKWLPEKWVCRFLPWVVAGTFVATAVVPRGSPLPGFLVFSLAGLGCSALLPLTISFGQRELTTIAASVAGGLIAFYELGYGIAAFGVGPLQSSAGLGLNVIFGSTAVIALAMAFVAIAITQNHSAQ